MQLLQLKSGVMFRRTGGNYRYITSPLREGEGAGAQVYCYNLDGDSVGYFHPGREEVVLVPPDYPSQQGMPVTEYHPPQRRPPAIERFWMCYVEGSKGPSLRHYSYQVAMVEAERLARATGRGVYLLCATHYVAYQPPIQVDRAIQWKRL